MIKHPCYVCGQNMTVAAHRRIAFREVPPHKTVEVGRDCLCYRDIVAAGFDGIARSSSSPPEDAERVFATLEQARNWDAAQRMAALFPAVPPP